jgi:hypothetical protein
VKPQLTTIMPEVIDCISEGRHPSDDELRRVADHIWADVRGRRSAFAWGDFCEDSSDRRLTLRAAEAALVGDGSASARTDPPRQAQGRRIRRERAG